MRVSKRCVALGFSPAPLALAPELHSKFSESSNADSRRRVALAAEIPVRRRTPRLGGSARPRLQASRALGTRFPRKAPAAGSCAKNL